MWLCSRARLWIIQLSCSRRCSEARRWLHRPMLSRCVLFLRVECNFIYYICNYTLPIFAVTLDKFLYLLRIVSYSVRWMNVRKLPCASLEWKRSRRGNYSRIDRSPVCDRSKIVPSLWVQSLMVELLLLLLIVNFTPIFQGIDRVTCALADICYKSIEY